jgi:hypothetical protein
MQEFSANVRNVDLKTSNINKGLSISSKPFPKKYSQYLMHLFELININS